MGISICGSLLASTMLLGQTADVPSTPQSTTDKTVTYQSSSTTTQTQPQKGPILSWFSREDRPVLSRIQSWFGRKDQKEQKDMVEPPLLQQTNPAPNGLIVNDGSPQRNPGTGPLTPPDFPRRMPNPASQTPAAKELPTPIQPPASQPVSPKTSSSAPVPSAGNRVQQASLVSARPQGEGPEVKVAKSPILPSFISKIGRDERFAWITGQLEIENGAFVLYYATPDTVDQFHGRLVLQTQKVDMGTFHRGDLVCARGELIQRQTALQGMTAFYRASDVQAIERTK